MLHILYPKYLFVGSPSIRLQKKQYDWPQEYNTDAGKLGALENSISFNLTMKCPLEIAYPVSQEHF